MTKRTPKKALAAMTAAQKKHARMMAKIEAGLIEAGTAYVKNSITYRVRKDGIHERVPTIDHPVTREDVVYLLTNVRALELGEILHQTSRAVLAYMLKNGFLCKMDYGLFWITVTAQRHYMLPDLVLSTGIKAKYLA